MNQKTDGYMIVNTIEWKIDEYNKLTIYMNVYTDEAI